MERHGNLNSIFVLNKKLINSIIQVATPYSTGTGFYWATRGVYVTCEHIVRDNREVIVQHANTKKKIAKVLFTDSLYDVAFLEAKEENSEKTTLKTTREEQGAELTAYGFTPNTHLKTETVHLISPSFQYEGQELYLMDKEMETDYTGGPLINQDGIIVGMNIGWLAEDEYQLALSGEKLKSIWEDYSCGEGKIGARCHNCTYLFFEGEVRKNTCPKCKEYLQLPNQAKPFQPNGIGYTIEKLIEKTGHEPKLSRRGPNNWQIQQGSARVNISYYEKNGLISGDAHLCYLPEDNAETLQFLLQENHKLEGLTFSIDHRDIILSLLLHDSYLNVETGIKFFRHLFKKADYYDNILVEQYGAKWYGS